MDRINDWAKAIQEFEGWYPGSRSQVNNNPGNLRFVRQDGAIPDMNGYAIFSTYNDGWNALVCQLRRACHGQSRVYKANMTLLDFFEKYAPSSDGNNPWRYTQFVAKRLGISILTSLKELVKE